MMKRTNRPEGRPGRPAGPPGAAGGPRRQFFRRRKVCKFCQEKIDVVDYKEARMLGQFISERGKILPRRLTGTCAPHQRLVAVAIKRARNIALLPFATQL
ncbi:MAG TPA: 30S ribosomal protein S18 [Terriglobia bacterium]|nr:30S ribosomal protein S18 [Terriglobia bacterium]